MTTEKRIVQVICDHQSHPRKVAKIDRFLFHSRAATCADNVPARHAGRTCLEVGAVFPCAACAGNDWRLVPGGAKWETLLIADDVVEPHRVYGSVSRAPDMELMDSVRRRYPLKCPLCGLRADFRIERLEALLVHAATRGDGECVRLSTLVAIL